MSTRVEEAQKKLAEAERLDALDEWATKEIAKYNDDQLKAMGRMIRQYFHGDGIDD